MINFSQVYVKANENEQASACSVFRIGLTASRPPLYSFWLPDAFSHIAGIVRRSSGKQAFSPVHTRSPEPLPPRYVRIQKGSYKWPHCSPVPFCLLRISCEYIIHQEKGQCEQVVRKKLTVIIRFVHTRTDGRHGTAGADNPLRQPEKAPAWKGRGRNAAQRRISALLPPRPLPPYPSRSGQRPSE